MRRIRIGHVIWEIFKAGLWGFLGVIFTCAALVYAMTYHADKVTEQWTYTDGHGASWECMRVPGTHGICRSVQAGQQTFCQDCPEPTACRVVYTRGWNDLHEED